MADSSVTHVTAERQSPPGTHSDGDGFDLGVLMTHYEAVRDQLWPLHQLLLEVKQLWR